MKSKWEDGIAVIFFVIIVGVFFRQTILEGKLPVPSDALVGLYHPWRDLYAGTNPRGIPFKNFLITDPVRQQIPWRKIAIEQWKEGSIPWWNPYNFSGGPLLANIQSAALYPLNILFLVLPFIDAWTMLIIIQPLFAGLFMYWYLRAQGLRPSAGLLGAISWCFSGFNIAWMTWGTIAHVALWLPLALLSIDKSISLSESKSLDRFVWLFLFVVSMTFQFFAGHAQISLYFILVVIAYGAMRIFQAKERKKAFFLVVVLFSVVALFTSVQWIPFLDWIRESSRVMNETNWHKEGWFIPWAHLVQFVAPDFFGNPTTLNYWGQWNYGEFVGYIGILPLVFAVLSLLSGAVATHLFWIGLLVAALLFAFPTPVSPLPFILNIPILSSLQPTRLLFIIDFALAILASYGLQEFLKHTTKRRWLWSIIALSGIFLILWGMVVGSRIGILDTSLRGSFEVSARNLILPTVLFVVSGILLFMNQHSKNLPFMKHIIPWVFVVLVIVDLFRFGWKFTPFTPKDYFFPETKVVAFLKKQKQPFRVISLDKRIVPPNTLSYFGIESIEGYDPIVSGRYEEFIAALTRGKPDISSPFGFNRIVTLGDISTTIEPILNAKYILSLSALSKPYLKLLFEDGETKVYEDMRALPRAYLVERIVTATSKEEAIAKLFDLSHLRQEAVVEGKPDVINVPFQEGEMITLTRYEHTMIIMDVQVDVPRLLVISNAFNDRWKAFVDGSQVPIYRTNYVFMGIVVSQGRHVITLQYNYP